MTLAAINHIELDDRGIAYIAGTRMKVHILIGIMNANQLTAEQMMDGYPQLSKAQVFAMLAYYHDHKDEIDRRNDEECARAVEMQQQSEKEHPELYKKLREAHAKLERGESIGGSAA